ncbi:hypothetical protein [Marivita sp.]|jgi:NADPH:quinone reductase-like Zn-dependent oxidoreductase|uniref:hypothetical protein n=1 Tax=Marivita sp. TaxID=2003365 RepID=UPI0032192C1F
MERTFSASGGSQYGGLGVLKPIADAVPSPFANQVLIRIRASAVSRADHLTQARQPKFARLYPGAKKPRADLSGTCLSGDATSLGDDLKEVLALMDRMYPFADLVKAHRYVETDRKRGNVVVA